MFNPKFVKMIFLNLLMQNFYFIVRVKKDN